MRFQVQNLDGAREELLPKECRGCGWWQGHDDGWPKREAAEAWMSEANQEIGFWGKMATGDDELLGFIQFGPAGLFSRAEDIAGKEIRSSFLLTCSHVSVEGVDSIRKSLLMAALAELQEMDVAQLDAFCAGKEVSGDCRLFDRKFLGDCGFYPMRDIGDLTVMRLELGGADPGRGSREKSGRRLLDRFKHTPAAPSPAAMCRRKPQTKPAS